MGVGLWTFVIFGGAGVVTFVIFLGGGGLAVQLQLFFMRILDKLKKILRKNMIIGKYQKIMKHLNQLQRIQKYFTNMQVRNVK